MEQTLAQGAFLRDVLEAPADAYANLFRVPERRSLVRLKDGRSVPFREVRPEDLEALRRFHSRLSERSIRLRFFGPKPELTEERARYFTHVDGRDRFALVALDPQDLKEIIGVVRFDRDGDSAEYAAIVEDRWQGLGLGFALTRKLVEAARERGIEKLHAYVMPENRRMVRLLKRLDLPETMHWEDGVEKIEISLNPR
jgi:RimJ/RimL family protein N-acetyltransferase